MKTPADQKKNLPKSIKQNEQTEAYVLYKDNKNKPIAKEISNDEKEWRKTR